MPSHTALYEINQQMLHTHNRDLASFAVATETDLGGGGVRGGVQVNVLYF